MLREFLDGSNPQRVARFILNGGSSTLADFADDHGEWVIPKEHIEFLEELKLWYETDDHFFVHAGVNPSLPLDAQSEEDQVWIREPFLSSSRDFGRLIVHGHTPVLDGRPDLRRNRLNIDTAAVLGGPLTAAVFTSDRTEPIAYLTHLGRETEAATLPRP
ncbi:MAG: hypothetical protein K6T17_02760 [Fimbriimonadales bacterium]|nr:hypothetical protein [Fimbriimonadales bacterium]